MKTKQFLFIAIVVAILVSMIAIPAAAEDEIPMWVSNIHLAYKSRNSSSARVVGTVYVRDANQDAVAGATVVAEFTNPEGYVDLATADTSDQGAASFQLWARESGPYKLCVVTVYKEGWEYDPDLNRETCDTLIVP